MVILQRSWLFCLCVLTLMWAGSLHAAPLVLDPHTGHHAIRSGLDYRIDTTGTLDITRIIASDDDSAWVANGDEVPNLGFTSAYCWFRFRISNANSAPSERLLEIGYTLLDSVELFQVEQGQVIASHILGNSLPFAERAVAHRNLIFPLQFAAESNTTVYLRVKSGNGMQVPVDLWQERAFWVQDQQQLAWQCLYFGLVMVMILYNLFLAWGTRDSTYFYYVMTILSVCVFQMILHGVANQFLWPALPAWNAVSIALLIPLSNAFSSLFCIRVLAIREKAPLYYTLLKIQIYTAPVLALASLLVPFQYVIPVSTSIVVVTSGWVTLYSIGRWREGDLDVRIFVIAWTSFVLGCFFMALNKFGFIAYSWWSENLMQLGSAIEAVLLSLALAARINRLQADSLAMDRLRFSAREQEIKSEREILEAKYESKAKSDFLAVMSHEIRTPMNGVLGVIDLLKDTRLSDQQNTLVNTIQSSGKLLLNIINDILDYSKIEAGKLELEIIPFQFSQIVQDALSIHLPGAQQKGLMVASYIDPDLAPALMGDPSRLKQVVFNLLGNAIKFTANGHVFVRISLRENSASEQLVRVEIADSGIGMNAEQKARLFQSFSQADKSTSRKFGGTGLGLAISKQLVTTMGGKIGVESSAGVGSTFWFELRLPYSSLEYCALERNRQSCLFYSDYLPFLEFIETSLNKRHFSMHGVVIAEGQFAAPDSTEKFDRALAFIRHGVQVPLLLAGSAAAVEGAVRDSLAQIAAGREPVITGTGLLSFESPYLLNQLMGMPVENQLVTVPVDEAPAQTPSLRTLKTLVAEDNPVNQLVVRELLKPLVGTVEIVNNGREALEKVTAALEPYDLIFMDCEMPEMDGYEATLRIREFEHASGCKKPVKVVALTAHAFEEYRQKALAVGMDTHLSKPVTRATLSRFLEEEFGRKVPLAIHKAG